MTYVERLERATTAKEFLRIAKRKEKLTMKELVHAYSKPEGGVEPYMVHSIRSSFAPYGGILFHGNLIHEIILHYQGCKPRKRPTLCGKP